MTGSKHSSPTEEGKDAKHPRPGWQLGGFWSLAGSLGKCVAAVVPTRLPGRLWPDDADLDEEEGQVPAAPVLCAKASCSQDAPAGCSCKLSCLQDLAEQGGAEGGRSDLLSTHTRAKEDVVLGLECWTARDTRAEYLPLSAGRMDKQVQGLTHALLQIVTVACLVVMLLAYFALITLVVVK